MNRAVMHVLAGLAGFVMGWALTTSPMAWGLAGTRVTWNASSCPAGVYTITSMARSAENGRTHVASSSNVTLPRAEVVQEFSGLPAGVFAVTAVARHSDGTQFESTQTIVSAGDGVILPPTATPPQPSRSAARRRRGNDAMGQAQPRPNPNSIVAPPTRSADAPGTARVETTAKADATSIHISKSDLEYIQIQLNDIGDPAADGSTWRRISLVDSDADGLTDVILVEMNNGDVRLWHLRR